jgi:mRNA interferase RelE/StbE
VARYTVYITKRAAKELSKNVAHQDKDRVKDAITDLGEEPRPRGYRKIKDVQPTLFRVRVGDYRVFYRVRDAEQAVVVTLVRRRSEDTYRNL